MMIPQLDGAVVQLRLTAAACSLCCSGGEGLAEVRDGAAAQEVCGSDPDSVPRGLEVQGDEDQAEGRGPVLHRQGEERRSGAPYSAATAIATASERRRKKKLFPPNTHEGSTS